MTRKIFQSIIGVAVAVLLGSVLIVMGVLYSYFEEESMDQLRNEAAYAASGIETMGVEYLDGISKQDDSVRITLVAADGSVTYDSLMDERSMENHGEREEIKAAVEKGEGSSARYSDTIDEKTINYALRLPDGSVLRVSRTQVSIWVLFQSMSQMIAIILAGAIILSCLIAYRLSRRIVRPLNEIDFEHPENTENLADYEEIRPLLNKLHLQNKMLQNEMDEREKMRREFTANVSHELKTPLTSISGFAEIMRDGLVKQEDIPRFSGKIYTESQRLIRLVEDIIKLSQLDEKELMYECESVDLSQLIYEVIFTLTPEAGRRNISIAAEAAPVKVNGIRQILMEMIYNLCDNAVKYNREGGRVLISLGQDGRKVRLSVKDTGIGIPEEEQTRIFERFYRVDKSHSKEVGGTGLGLAIVKHAAALHEGKIELHSRFGEGTEIIVTLPGETAE